MHYFMCCFCFVSRSLFASIAGKRLKMIYVKYSLRCYLLLFDELHVRSHYKHFPLAIYSVLSLILLALLCCMYRIICLIMASSSLDSLMVWSILYHGGVLKYYKYMAG